jgi:uncharacterized protein YqeY
MPAMLERLQQEMKTALKAGDKERLGVLRLLINDLKVEQGKRNRDDLTPDEETAVLMRAAKARKESIEQAEKFGRADIAAKEKYELALIETYLPVQMSEAEVEARALELIADLGLAGKKDAGRFMKEWMSRHKGAADGKTVQMVVGRLLQ